MSSAANDASLIDRLRAATEGEFAIVRELGRGGFATVFLAHDLAIERDVAIKVLTAGMDGDAGDQSGEIERFRREARTAGGLSHPHIIPIFANRSKDGLQFFVMKFVKGRPLDAIIKDNGALPLPLVQTILRQAGAALAYAHRSGVVHRDIKPANIMLDDDGWAVVADFGIAKVAMAEKLTATGIIIGTAAYMSPEQWAGRDISGLSDEYSLGIVAYELLTGFTPFDGATIPALLWAHLNETPPPITDRRADCPPALEDIVRRMLEKDPDARYAVMDDAVAAIAALPLQEAPEKVRTRMISLATVQLGPGSAVLAATEPQRSPIMPSNKVARLSVTPASADVTTGASLRLQVSALNATGQQLARRAVAWRSLDVAVATVDADGVVTARGRGQTKITATCESSEISVPVVVVGSRAEASRGVRAGRWIGAVAATALAAAGVLWQQGVLPRRNSAVDSTAVLPAITAPSGPGGKAADTSRVPSGAGTPQAIDSRTGAAVPLGRDTTRKGALLAAPSTAAGVPAVTAKDSSTLRALAGASPAGTSGGESKSALAGSGAASSPATTPPAEEPKAAGVAVVEVSAGGAATCAAMSNGTEVLCWGGDAPAGALVSGFYFSKLAVGGGHICGLTPDGLAYCWGENAQGQLGDGSTTTRTTPTAVKATARFTEISIGAAHTCALGADGSAWCWGGNKYGQLGDNSLNARSRPVLVRGSEAFQALSAGGSHSCGVRRSGKAYCWGDGFSGQIGNAMQEIQREPFPVKTDLIFRTVVTGERHTCGLSSRGRAYCWGDNTKGQLGNDTHDDRNVPDSVASDLIFTALTAGAGHTCGITSTRALACWGENGSGQLGDGTRSRREVPVIVARGFTWKQVSAGAAHTCGISRANNAVLCWGANTRGQVGTGTAGAMSPLPTLVKVSGRSG